MSEKSKEKMNRITIMLQEGVENVFSSEKYAEWLRVCSKFHNYSLNNQILIMMQAPYATRVAGYRTWQSMGRQVRKGEKSLMIIAPMRIKKEDVDEFGNEDEKELLLFKAVSVFDISQTDGEDLPSIADELTDDDTAYDDIINRLVSFAPVPVEFTDIPGTAYGYFSPKENKICIRKDISRQHQCKTLIHEIAHSLCDADPKVMTDRQTKEVRAESVAYCVSSALGIDTSQYSFGYIASWSSGKELTELKAGERQIFYDLIYMYNLRKKKNPNS